MKKVFAIEHLRTLLMATFVFIPVLIGAMWFGLTFLISGEEGYEDPSADLYIGIAVLTAGAVTIGIMLWFIFLALRPQRYIEDMDRLAAGEGWVHWSYDEALWKSANEVESARLRKGFGAAYGAVGIGAAFLLLGFVTGGELGETSRFAGAITLLGGGGAIAIMWLSGAGAFTRDGRTGEAHISELGVLRRPGGYTAFAPTGPLMSVRLVAGSPTRVVFTAVQRGRYGATSDHHTADLLVPPGREEEARALVERFKAEVLKAS